MRHTYTMFFSSILTIAYFASEVVSVNFFSQCNLKNTACLEKSSNAALPLLMLENTQLGVTSSDPLLLEKIEGNLSILKFNFYNSTYTGFKDSTISNLKINDDISRVQCDLTFPKMSLAGKYDISGRLVILPVEGSGDYYLTTGKYVVNVDLELKKFTGKDGKTHVAVKNFKLKSTPLEPMFFDFKNLFNGQKDLSDAVHKFAHENWKEVADLVQDPIWYACYKKMISNVNKYLKHIALEDFIVN